MYTVDVIYTAWPRDMYRTAYMLVSGESVMGHLSGLDGVDLRYYMLIETADADPFRVNDLCEFCQEHGWQYRLKTAPASLSSAMNEAHHLGEGEFILFMQDDWQMTQNLTIRGCCDFLHNHGHYDMIRLKRRPEFGVKENNMGAVWPGVCELSWSMRGYYYSDNPHFKRRSMVDVLGEYPDSIKDGKDQGRCENAINRKAKQVAAKTREHRIVFSVADYFDHMGNKHTSLRDKTFDR